MNDKVERHAALCKTLNEMYQRKNHDYGDSFHQSYLEEGIVTARFHLGEKMNRFKTLSKKPDAQQVQGESIRDTLLDLANYAIMTVMELESSHYDRFKADE